MNTRNQLLLFLITGLMLVVACSKGGAANDGNGGGGNPISTSTDTTAPVLNINTPGMDQVFNNGNTIQVTGRITDNAGLYRGSIRITNDANADVLKEQLYEIHYMLSYDFNVSYTANVSIPSNYTVTVRFEDHWYNSVSKSVKVKVNP